MDKINVEVAYALSDEQTLLNISVPEGISIKEAILSSDILNLYPDLDIDKMSVGIFGKMAKMDQIMRDRDRVEIYRPLIADPKEVRKRKAAEGKKLKKGGDAIPKEKA